MKVNIYNKNYNKNKIIKKVGSIIKNIMYCSTYIKDINILKYLKFF